MVYVGCEVCCGTLRARGLAGQQSNENWMPMMAFLNVVSRCKNAYFGRLGAACTAVFLPPMPALLLANTVLPLTWIVDSVEDIAPIGGG